MPEPHILVRGANDIGSAVALRLFQAEYSVILHELPLPTVARRKMSLADAVFDGHASLNGVEAQLVENWYLLRRMLMTHQVIPVIVRDFYELLRTLRPQVVVDARMRKHIQPENQRGLAEFVIGLGPNFVAGETVDAAIETNWGASLGQVIAWSATKSLQGEPREIEGHARDRYVYAPVTGIFHTALHIGDTVSQGQEVARIDSTPLHAPIAGILRGLTHDGVPVTLKTKIIEVDPRMQGAQISGIGERPARIAEGVISAIQKWEAGHISFPP